MWKLSVCARNLNVTTESRLNKEGNEARKDNEKGGRINGL